jgi:adenosylhomocysteinase
MTVPLDFDIADPALAESGRRRTNWAARQMPVLGGIAERFASERPLDGVRFAVGLHVTPETAVLLRALRAGGAQIALCASNPLSTRDDVCATLVVHEGIPVHARYREDLPTYYRHVESVLAHRPHVTMDDGADLIVALHRRPALLGTVFGGMEETTTGVIRVRAMARSGALAFPVVAVNDTPTKRFFDNRYGTGQNTVDGILRATNVLLAGKTAVVAGYGWVGRGIALRLRGMGANVIVTEVSPIAALEAVMEGYRVLPMETAAAEADVVVTATGGIQILAAEHFSRLRDGVLLCNSGHFDVEIDVKGLRALAVERAVVRDNVEEYVLPTGQRVYLLAEGRLVGQAAAEASPASVMDLSFAGQALAAEWLVQRRGRLEAHVHDLPRELDDRIARLKLQALGIALDTLSPRQVEYQSAWREGT